MADRSLPVLHRFEVEPWSALAVAARSPRVAAAALGGGVDVLDLTGELVGMADGDTRYEDVALSDDGATLATYSKDGTVDVLDVASGARRIRVHAERGDFHHIRFSPDGSRLLALIGRVGAPARARVWATADGEALEERELVSQYVFPLVSADLTRVVARAAPDRAAILEWRREDAELIRIEGLPEFDPMDVALSRDAEVLACTTTTSGLRVVRRDPASEVEVPRTRPGAGGLALDDRGDLAAWIEGGSLVSVLETATGGLRARGEYPGAGRVAIVRDGAALLVGQRSGVVQVLDLAG